MNFRPFQFLYRENATNPPIARICIPTLSEDGKTYEVDDITFRSSAGTILKYDVNLQEITPATPVNFYEEELELTNFNAHEEIHFNFYIDDVLQHNRFSVMQLEEHIDYSEPAEEPDPLDPLVTLKKIEGDNYLLQVALKLGTTFRIYGSRKIVSSTHQDCEIYVLEVQNGSDQFYDVEMLSITITDSDYPINITIHEVDSNGVKKKKKGKVRVSGATSSPIPFE